MINNLDIKTISDKLKTHQLKSVDIVLECFENINKFNKNTNALISVRHKEEALKQAQICDKTINSKSSILFGIPYILKDSYLTQELPTTASSNVLKGFMSPYNATVHEKLLNSGAILIGKANMDAWGHGATSENNDFGSVKNPWDLTRTAGGSTGGVAAALACGMAIFGIGEDTGGSIRNPSAWCNITGLKVSYGRVSRYGCISYASSFDTVGPMARNVSDLAYILEEIAGVDRRDASSASEIVPKYSQNIGKTNKYKIGIVRSLISNGLDEEIKNYFNEFEKNLVKLGYSIVNIEMPMLEYGLPVYYLIAPSETSSNLARYDGIRYGNGRENFTDETKRRIMIGTFALSAGYYDAYYKKAQQVRTLFINEYEKAFNSCDAVLMPVTAINPPKLGEATKDPLQNMLIDLFTVTQNPVGLPSLSLPAGFSKSKLPIGVQLVGRKFSEEVLLEIGNRVQNITNYHKEIVK